MPSEEQLARLPKWAQQEIRKLQRQRDAAVRKLNEMEDSQTPSRVWTEDIVHLADKGPQFVRQYFQAEKLEIEHAGVSLSIRGLHHGSKQINLTWNAVSRAIGPIYFVPEAFQQARLVAPENV
jgi:hypothetical protein